MIYLNEFLSLHIPSGSKMPFSGHNLVSVQSTHYSGSPAVPCSAVPLFSLGLHLCSPLPHIH